MKKHYFLFLVIILLTGYRNSIAVALDVCPQAQIVWQKSLGGTGIEEPQFIRQTFDGGFVIAGYSQSNDGNVSGNHGSSDFWIVKIDSLGTLQWQKSLGGTGSDMAFALVQSNDSGYVVAGQTTSTNGDVTGNHGTTDVWVLKLSRVGNLLWQKSLGGTANDGASSIGLTSDGGYMVAGISRSSNGDVPLNHGLDDYWAVKLDAAGNIQYSFNPLGGTASDVANSVQQTNDHGYILAGRSASSNGDVTGHHGGSNDDYWIVKLDSLGFLQWQKSVGGNLADVANSILQTTDRGYIIAGRSTSTDGDVTGNHGSADYWIVRLDSNGTLLWQKSLGGSGFDEANSIQPTSDGGYIIGGTSSSNDGDVSGNHGSSDYWIVKIDALGNLQWQKSLGGPGADEANFIHQTTNGQYIIAGSSASTNGDVTGNHGNLDYWVVRLTDVFTVRSYADADGDGFGNLASILYSCTVPSGYVLNSTDCNDANPGIHALQQYFLDTDLDGFGSAITGQACSFTPPAGFSTSNTDCNDADATVHAPQSYFVDGDHDGFGSTVTGTACASIPPFGFSSNNADCSDTDAGVHVPLQYYVDTDHDTYGSTDGAMFCNSSPPNGYSGTNTDCNDLNGTIYPGAIEITGNTIDENCNGSADDVCHANQIQWQKSLGGTGSDMAFAAVQSNDGGYVIAGQTTSANGDVTGNHGSTDFWVVKLTSTGSLVWQKALGGTANDGASSIGLTADGGYIVAGSSRSSNGDVFLNQGLDDYWAVKLDALGNIQWSFDPVGGTLADVPNSVQQTKDGGYILTGRSASSDGHITGHHGGSVDDYWIVKLDSSGILQWQKSLGGTGADVANSILQTSDGGYIAAGRSASTDGDVTGNHGSADFWIVRLDTVGNLLWQKSLGGSAADEANSIQPTSDGGYIIGGISSSNNGDVTGNHGSSDYWVVKTDALGNLQWQKSFGGSAADEAKSVQQTKDGGYVVTGKTSSTNGDVTGNHGGVDFWVIKLDKNGNLKAQKTVGGTGDETALSIRQSNDWGYIVAGQSTSTNGDVTGNHGSTDFWVVKLWSVFVQKIFADADGDGYGNQATSLFSCLIAGYAADSTDCNDANSAIHPGAPELCNNMDDNCNGTIDDACLLSLNLKVFIEGFYIRHDSLAAVLDPLISPTVCDSITVDLYDGVTPHDLITSVKGPISTKGTGQFLFPQSVIGHSYYIAVRSRNAMETWSKIPVLFAASTSYNFTIQD